MNHLIRTVLFPHNSFFLFFSLNSYLKRLRANRDEENELMKDVPGWKTGTLYGQPVYHNVRDRFIEPSHKEFLAHISWHQMFDILYERRKH